MPRLLRTTCIASVGHDDPACRLPAAPNGAWWQGIPCGGAVKRKNALSLRSYGRGAPCRAAGCGSKPSCPINAAPTRTRVGLLAGHRTWYAVLHSQVIGQKPNLTSDSFRAFRSAKRCLGGRGGVPLFDGLCGDFRPSLAAAGADASLRAGWLGWLIGLSVGADDLGGPNPRPS